LRWDLAGEVLEAACDSDQAQRAEDGPGTLSDVLLAARYLVGVGEPAELSHATFLAAPAFHRLRLDHGGALAVLKEAAAEFASLRAALAD
jgi:hypothetical protein